MSHASPFRVALCDPIASDPPRFMVAGQAGTASGDVKMYEWHRHRGDMSLVGLQTDVGNIKAVAWSPAPTHRNLAALGLATGRTLLLNLSPETLALPASANTSSNLLPSSAVSVLPVKHVRSTTSLAFCPRDPNYLATGYERHRSDYSLLIWDLSTALSVIPPDGDANWQRPLDRLEVTNTNARDATRLNPSEPKHIQHYCPAEHVNDITFLPTGYSLLASANSKVIRLYDLRGSGPASTAAGAPRDPTTAHAAGAALQWSTRAVSGITPDHINQHRFASYEAAQGGNGSSTVKLWDSRKSGIEVASFEVKSAVTGLEWTQTGKGYSKLAVGSRDGVSVWDIVNGKTTDQEEQEEWTLIGDVRSVVKSKQGVFSFAFANSLEKNRSDVLFVVRDGSIGIGPVLPIPTVASGSRGDVALASSSLSILDPDGEGQGTGEDNDYNADNNPKVDDDDDDEETPRSNRFQLHPARISDILAEASRSRNSSTASSLLKGLKPAKLRKATRNVSVRISDDLRDGNELGWEGWRRALRLDVGCVMRRRAEEGYGLSNLLLNAAIATRFPGYDRLSGIWEFIDHLTKVMDPNTSVTRSLTLTFAGIYAIWTGQDLYDDPLSGGTSTPSLQPHSPLISDTGRPPSSMSTREPVKQGSAAWTSLRNTQHNLPTRTNSTPIESSRASSPPASFAHMILPDADFAAAVETINAKRDNGEHPGRTGRNKLAKTDKAAQRKMILAVCGEREAEQVNRHIEDELRTKAASWAYFSGEEENAVRILTNSNNSKHRLLGTTLAGFLSQSRSTRATDSSFFDEHWRSLIARVDDPYIRAVLSRVGGDDLESVLEEEAIPLLDRVAIAVCNLSDEELTQYLKGRLGRFTRNPSPSLSSLALTGFTSPAIGIMQKWLERTGDVQTIAILSAHFPASRLTRSERQTVRRWQESYRDLLDGWGMWGERVEFDVGRMDVARALSESQATEEHEKDDSRKGTCPVCNNVLSAVHEEHLQLKSGLSREKSLPSERTGQCTLCGQILPRCVICLRHVAASFQSAHAPKKDDNDDSMFTPLNPSDTIDAAYIACLTCRHGGHANHIIPWFQGGLDGEEPHDVCPVAGCSCECANI